MKKNEKRYRLYISFRLVFFKLIFLTLALTSVGCEDTDVHNYPPGFVLKTYVEQKGIDLDQPAPRHKLLLLPDGTHLGYIEGFNPDNSKKVKDILRKTFKETVVGGMKVARVQLDWMDLEPKKGQYLKNELIESLSFYSDYGLAIALLVTTADSSSLVYPKDLVNEEQSDFVDGMKADDPYIVDRFIKLLEWVLPIAKQHGVYAISIGNEPDTRHADDPAFMSHFIQFVKMIQAAAHEIEPDIAVTFTATTDILQNPQHGYGQDLANAVQMLTFNFYCIGGPDGLDKETMDTYFDRMIQLAGTKTIQIQELGCPSQVFMDKNWVAHRSSEAIQQEFFKWIFPKIRTSNQIRAAYIFQMVDQSPVINKFYRDLLSAEDLPEDFINNIVSGLESLGMMDFETGRKKAAWQEFLNWYEQ